MKTGYFNTMKSFMHKHFSEQNITRARIIYRAILDLKQTFQQTKHTENTNVSRNPFPLNDMGSSLPGYPIPVHDIRETLLEMGISRGDVIHVQSSLSHLYRGASAAPKEPVANHLSYAIQIVDMLIDLVGTEGTILMNTEPFVQEIVTRIWIGDKSSDTIFDYKKTPSNRGLISEIFRRHPGAIRSVHPWYNVTGWGKLTQALLQDNHQSTPYAMDIHSPWYKLTEVGGKTVLLGGAFLSNSPLHLVEYVYPDKFPRGVYLNKPVKMQYVDYDQQVKDIEIMLHAPLWWREAGGTGHGGMNFSYYLNHKYHIYTIKQFCGVDQIVCYDAKAQFDAVYKEMENNVTWYDPGFWAESISFS